MVELYTSRWANRELARLPVVLVGISRGTPKFPLPYRYRMARLMAPSRETFALRSDEAFEAAYLSELEQAGVEKIGTMLTKISGQEGGRPLALLCFEDVRAGQVCHRRMFAEWWRARTGILVPEFGSEEFDGQRPLFSKEG